MKKKCLFICILLLSMATLPAFAQRHGITSGLGIDYTAAGPLSSMFVGIELNRHEIGMVRQSRLHQDGIDYTRSYRFTGGYYQFTFYREKHLQMGLMLRGGLVNDKFFLIAPALSVSFVCNDYMKLTMITGMRAQVPSFSFNLFINLPFKRHEYPYPLLVK